MLGKVFISKDKLLQKEINKISKDKNLQQLAFKSGINWMSVTIVYLRESSEKISPKLVVCMNDLEDAISLGDDACLIWQSYYNLINEAKITGIDLLNMPFHFFGRSFH